ncbi:MAG: nucleotidyltransferase [Clostridiaceae bacterium BRH_c20a]|nr:MAG: nucleotidyltransferase [Clostridiaceae bacterium BRH_c20a]
MASFYDTETIKLIASQFAELVRSEMNIKSVYLYGSVVKGTNTEDSDIDIAVIGDDFSGDPVEDTLKLMKIRRKVDNRIEPHPFKSSEFNKTNPFVAEIITTGIKIM